MFMFLLNGTEVKDDKVKESMKKMEVRGELTERRQRARDRREFLQKGRGWVCLHDEVLLCSPSGLFEGGPSHRLW